MSTIITRLYKTHKQALDAVNDLKRNGFSEGSINLVASAGDGEAGSGTSSQSADALVASILKGGVSGANAKVYAEAVRRGGSLVTVVALFGSALKAGEILDRFDPVIGGVPASDEYAESPGPIAQLLKGRSKTVLLDQAAPFSSLLHIPAVIRGRKSGPAVRTKR
jgi:hypothetical protein